MRSSSAASAAATTAGPRSRVGATPLDLVHLTRQTFGDKRLETELLRLFVHQAVSIGRVLGDRSSGHDDLELLHTLTGSARAVGAFEVARQASAGESALRRADRGPTGFDDDDRDALRAAIDVVVGYVVELLEQR